MLAVTLMLTHIDMHPHSFPGNCQSSWQLSETVFSGRVPAARVHGGATNFDLDSLFGDLLLSNIYEVLTDDSMCPNTSNSGLHAVGRESAYVTWGRIRQELLTFSSITLHCSI